MRYKWVDINAQTHLFLSRHRPSVVTIVTIVTIVSILPYLLPRSREEEGENTKTIVTMVIIVIGHPQHPSQSVYIVKLDAHGACDTALILNRVTSKSLSEAKWVRKPPCLSFPRERGNQGLNKHSFMTLDRGFSYTAEHMVGLESGLMLAAEIRPADHTDTGTLADGLVAA